MSKRTKIAVGAAIAMLSLVVAAFLWWSLRDEGPEAVDLEAAVALMESTGPGDSGDPSASEPDAGESATPTTEATTTASTAGNEPSNTALPSTVATTTPTTSAATSTTSTPVTEDTTTPTTSNSTTPPDTEDVPADASTTAPTTPVDAETTGLAGVWTVLTTEGTDSLSEDAAVSFAGYRVVEVLAGGVDESTAVGRTAAVSGWIELAGNALVAATVEVEMATLRTDDSHRDSHARQSLNTKEFPLATFTLVEPLELPPGIFEGERFAGSAEGDLTIKGVTNRAVFDLEAQLVGDVIVVVGSTEVVFSDYGVTAPTSRAVISVEDHGVMEFQLFLTR